MDNIGEEFGIKAPNNKSLKNKFNTAKVKTQDFSRVVEESARKKTKHQIVLNDLEDELEELELSSSTIARLCR